VLKRKSRIPVSVLTGLAFFPRHSGPVSPNENTHLGFYGGVRRGPAASRSPQKSPCGVGPGAWNREDNMVERAMALLGGTVDDGRVWDVMTAIRRRSRWGPWRVAGRGLAGILSAYAALGEGASRLPACPARCVS
jgi:hypothetical protein